MRQLLLMAVCLWASPVLAQDEPTAPESAAVAKSDFEKTQRLETLRYRHLWIAYGAAWLIIFGFSLRTWRSAERTETELTELKRRLAQLEGKQNG